MGSSTLAQASRRLVCIKRIARSISFQIMWFGLHVLTMYLIIVLTCVTQPPQAVRFSEISEKVEVNDEDMKGVLLHEALEFATPMSMRGPKVTSRKRWKGKKKGVVTNLTKGKKKGRKREEK